MQTTLAPASALAGAPITQPFSPLAKAPPSGQT